VDPLTLKIILSLFNSYTNITSQSSLQLLFYYYLFLLFVVYTVNLSVVRLWSCRVIYYFNTSTLGRRHQYFGRVTLGSPSNSRIMQLHGCLQDLRQGDDTVTIYLQKAKGLFDELTVAGRPISLTDLNQYMFHGLRNEFCDLVTSLSMKSNPLPYSELHSHLSTHKFLHRSSFYPLPTTAPLLPTLV